MTGEVDPILWCPDCGRLTLYPCRCHYRKKKREAAVIYQVWGIEKGEKPPQILLESFRLGTDAESSQAADDAAEELRADGATQVEVRIIKEGIKA